MSPKRYANVIGFDDAPFPPSGWQRVQVVGAIFANSRFDGVVIGEIEKDGFDATEELSRLVSESKFANHVQLIMLQGITFAGFNVVDVFSLHDRLKLPILVISRHAPDMDSIEDALLTHLPDGPAKWAIIERLGPMEQAGNVRIQRVGLTAKQARDAVKRFCIHSNVPEPIRVAHLVAGALASGESRKKP